AAHRATIQMDETLGGVETDAALAERQRGAAEAGQLGLGDQDIDGAGPQMLAVAGAADSGIGRRRAEAGDDDELAAAAGTLAGLPQDIEDGGVESMDCAGAAIGQDLRDLGQRYGIDAEAVVVDAGKLRPSRGMPDLQPARPQCAA